MRCDGVARGEIHRPDPRAALALWRGSQGDPMIAPLVTSKCLFPFRYAPAIRFPPLTPVRPEGKPLPASPLGAPPSDSNGLGIGENRTMPVPASIPAT